MTERDGGAIYAAAFDHRESFKRMLGISGEPTPEHRKRMSDAKTAFLDGVLRALDEGAPRGPATILLDEEYGADAARRARAEGLQLAMSVEKSGQPEFDFQYGEDFAAHVDEFDPTYVKVLVRYNPAGDPEVNRRQVARLVRLSSWVSERGRRLMFELLVPPERGQLEAVGGDFDRFDREVRPGLVLDTIRDLRSDGIDPEVWKIEGLDSRDDCRKVGDLVLSGGGRQAGCVVLGRGADAAMVDHWLKQAAGVPGFIGFAIGRTIWEKPLLDWLHGRSGRADTVAGIAANYRRNVEVYRSALGS